MNKKDLIGEVARSTGLTQIDAAKAVDAMLATLAAALKQGDTVRLIGFGTFSVSQRATRAGRNPRTGEVLMVKATRTPRFKAASSLKASVGPHGGGTDDDA